MNKKMILALVLAYLVIFQANSFAQDSQEAKTLFGNGMDMSTKDLGFFWAPSYGISRMDGSTASLLNLRGGIILKDRFSFGAYFNTSLNQIKPQSEILPNVYMDYWTVGGFAEYTLLSKKVVHLSFPLYMGYGEVEMDNESGDAGLGEANFFQIEPSVLLELNLHKHIRFNIGTGYRFVGKMSYRNFDQSDISGLTGYIGFKVGLFR